MKKLFLFSVLIAGPLAAMDQPSVRLCPVAAVRWLTLVRHAKDGLAILARDKNTPAIAELFKKVRTKECVSRRNRKALRRAGFVSKRATHIPVQICNAVLALQIADRVVREN